MKPVPDTCCLCGTTRDLVTTRAIDGYPRTACARCRMNACRLIGFLPTFIRTQAATVPTTKRSA